MEMLTRRVLMGTVFLLAAMPLRAAELSVDDFRFDGPLGSAGARIEKLGSNHFRMILGHAPKHTAWANNCQFQIVRHAKGNPLHLEVTFAARKPVFIFDKYYHSWSYDSRNWTPIQWSEKSNGRHNRLEFPVFEQDQVFVGVQAPMSCEDAEALLAKWARHPHAKLFELGRTLGGRKLYRLEVTDPDSPCPRARRWVHYFKNEHPGEHNAQWRMAGMIDWLLSDQGADCRRRSICHFVLMMSPDGPSKGWNRANAQGFDMNRTFRVAGADANDQAHEAYLCQKDVEALMASEAPLTSSWAMHTWGGPVALMVFAGPEIGKTPEARNGLREIFRKNDPQSLIKPVSFSRFTIEKSWNREMHQKFGITSFLCEGGGAIYKQEDHIASGVALMKSISEYYHGLRR